MNLNRFSSNQEVTKTETKFISTLKDFLMQSKLD